MANKPVSRTIVQDPRWLCHRYDPQFDAFHYRYVDRARHRAVPFLIDADLGPDVAPAVIARAEATSLVPPSTPAHFIFHSAFCGSTMLARALDVEGSAMSLSEPVVLNDLVGWQRNGADPQRHRTALAASLAQLARPWAIGEAVIVKPSNVFNCLAASALTLAPSSRAVILTAPLPVFLASVARKGLDGRLWVRTLLEGQLRDGLVDLGFAPADYFRLTDLQVAAVGWLAQQDLFARLCNDFGSDRLVTLGSEQLAARPHETVAAVAGFMSLRCASEADYRGHPAISRNSKSGEHFSPDQRRQDQEAAQQAHGDEIGKVALWAEAVATNAGVPMTLPHALR